MLNLPVFSKEATHVPPSQPYNYKINLYECFIPKIGKIYPLSPDEQKATEDFLNENFKCSKIHSLNFPKVSSFFLTKKKDGNLYPCQDYCYLNKHTVCNAYPLPLISNLIDKLDWHDIDFYSRCVWVKACLEGLVKISEVINGFHPREERAWGEFFISQLADHEE